MRALVFLVIAASTAAACNAVLGIDEGHLIADDAGSFTGGEDARRTDADTSEGGVEDDAAQGKDASDASVADQWKQAYRDDFLSDATWALASALGYDESAAVRGERTEFEL